MGALNLLCLFRHKWRIASTRWIVQGGLSFGSARLECRRCPAVTETRDLNLVRKLAPWMRTVSVK